MARAGEVPVLAAATVTIDRLELVEWDGTDPDRPIAIVEVDCSAGTYVRSLARDVGDAVGSGAYLGALVRTRSGAFALEGALSLEAIRAAAEAGSAGLARLLLPLDTGLEDVPAVGLYEAEIAAVGRGQFVRPAARPLPAMEPGDRLIAVDGTGRVVAIGVVRDGRFAPDKVLVEPPVPVDRHEPGLTRPSAAMDARDRDRPAPVPARPPVRGCRRLRRAPSRASLPVDPAPPDGRRGTARVRP